MSNQSTPLGQNEITMKTGKVNYNNHGLLQRRAIEPAISLLPDLSSYNTISIIDYGCSQGANSIAPLKALISSIPAGATITLTLNDQPFNDWNTVSRTLNECRDELTRNGDVKVFVKLSPTSFYNQITEDGTVDLALSWSALSYLEHHLPTPPFSSVPEMIAKRKERNAVAAHTDLVKLLRLRAQEVKKGGYFVATFGGNKEAEGISNMASPPTTYAMMKALQDMVAEGKMSQAQVLGMDPPLHERTITEARRSLEAVSDLWSVEHLSSQTVVHPAWDVLQASRKTETDYADYAETIVEWVFSAFEWYVVKGLRVGETEKGPRKPITETEREILDDYIARCKKYVKTEFGDLRCEVEYLYLKLVRK